MFIYIAVRKDFDDRGALGSQIGHAASEAASQWTQLNGREIDADARIGVLGVTKLQMEMLRHDLVAARVSHKAILETDGPLAGCHTAIGIVTLDKAALIAAVPLLDPKNPDGLKRLK